MSGKLRRSDEELRKIIEERLAQEAFGEIYRGRLRGYPLKTKEHAERQIVVDGRELQVRVPVLRYRYRVPEGRTRTFYPDYYRQLRQVREEELDRLAGSSREEGTSLRGIGRSHEKTRPEETRRGLSRSAMGRRSLRLDNATLEAVNSAPLGPLELEAAQFDALEIGGDTILFGVGIGRDGRKHLLGLEQDASESEEMVARFLGKLEERGAPLSEMLLCSDRGAGLRNAFAAAGYKATQICIVHVQRNVREHMASKLEFDGVAARLEQATRGRKRKEIPRLRAVCAELSGLGHQQAAEQLGDWVEGRALEARRDPSAKGKREEVPRELRKTLQQLLPASAWYGIRPYLHQAWAERDYETALGQLTAIEGRLFASGNRKAANTLRDAIEGTLTVTRLGVNSSALRKALQSTNIIESFNGQVRRQIRKLSPAWRDSDPLGRQRWAAGAGVNAARRWKRVAVREEEMRQLQEAVAAIETAVEVPSPRAADRLDPYVEVLGPRMLTLHAGLDERSAQLAAADAAARAAARPAVDPFESLEAVVARGREELIEHGARRVATATVTQERPGRRRPGSLRMPSPDAILARYERELGEESVAEIKDRAAGLAAWADGDARWVSECQRMYAEPYPPMEPFEVELDNWLERHGEDARTLVALEHADRGVERSAGEAIGRTAPDAAWVSASERDHPTPDSPAEPPPVDLDALLEQEPEEIAVPEPRGPAAPAIPTQPLGDSLFDKDNYTLLGPAAATDIKERAEAVRESRGFGEMTDESVREALPQPNPFEDLPKPTERTSGRMSSWWQEHKEEIVDTVAAEDELIARAQRAYGALAAREEKRRRNQMANPLEAVREARGDAFAAKVERHAAVAASRLASVPEAQRQRQTAALREEIQRSGGLGQARFGAIVSAVAHQHVRNVGNEREALRLREAGADQALDRGVGESVGAELR